MRTGDVGRIEDEPLRLAGESMEAVCIFCVTAENMEKLMAGILNPMLAYTLGKLKIDGSMGVAMKVAALLEE